MTISGRFLGSFSKGSKGAVTINFGSSGGANCDKACIHHPASNCYAHPTKACYGTRTEARPDRSQLADKLKRHESLPPAMIVGAALVELRQLVDRGKTPPWIRLCTNGALPQPERPPSCLSTSCGPLDVRKATRLPVAMSPLSRLTRQLSIANTWETFSCPAKPPDTHTECPGPVSLLPALTSPRPKHPYATLSGFQTACETTDRSKRPAMRCLPCGDRKSSFTDQNQSDCEVQVRKVQGLRPRTYRHRVSTALIRMESTQRLRCRP